jgi:DNA (cytosine-5)-methyltransferase 1
VCVQEPVCGASRGRYVTDEEGNVRTEQQLELNGTSISNTLTTVQTDSLVIEPAVHVDARVQQIANYLEGEGGYWKNPNNGRIYSREGLAPTLNCMEGGNRQPKIVEGDEEFQQPFKVRKLTERECWRLMGFSDEDVDKVKEAGLSRSQMYKQAGNSIVVDVLYNIFSKLPLDNI